jgi:sugar O-acyltransferase (sialic acid O-acetyltransferase NeuD family)
MRDLLIIGTGAQASELVEIVQRINQAERTWNLLGILANERGQVGGELNGAPVVGAQEDLDHYPQAALAPSFECSWKREAPRERLISLIDPTSFVSRTADIGAGCIIYPHCFVGTNAKIGDLFFCLSGSIVNHDDIIEDGVTFASGVSLSGSVHIEADCWLGQGCTVRGPARVGRGSLIGMGAVVVNDVPPHSVMVGNPARWLRERGKDERR